MARRSHMAACVSTTSHTTSRGRARISSTIREVKRIKRPNFGNRPHLSRMFDKALMPPKQGNCPPMRSGGCGYAGGALRFEREQVRRDRGRIVLFPRGDHWRKEAAVMHGRTKPIERLEMFRDGITLVALETVARAILRQRAHQAVARHLGDDGCR